MSVVYAKVPEGVPVKLFAASLSARHGDRLSNGDAKTVAREICTDNPEFDQSQIAKMLGLKQPTISGYVSDLIAKRREERRAKVLRLAMLGWTQREIAERLGVDQATVSLDMKNIETDIFHTGHAPEEIALRLGWPVQLVLQPPAVCDHRAGTPTIGLFSDRTQPPTVMSISVSWEKNSGNCQITVARV